MNPSSDNVSRRWRRNTRNLSPKENFRENLRDLREYIIAEALLRHCIFIAKTLLFVLLVML